MRPVTYLNTTGLVRPNRRLLDIREAQQVEQKAEVELTWYLWALSLAVTACLLAWAL